MNKELIRETCITHGHSTPFLNKKGKQKIRYLFCFQSLMTIFNRFYVTYRYREAKVISSIVFPHLA